MSKNLFKRLFKKNEQSKIKVTEIGTSHITEEDMEQLKAPNLTPKMCKYEILRTGEIITFPFSDEGAFEKMMTCGEVIQLLYD